MTSDLKALLRRRKPEKRTAHLIPRSRVGERLLSVPTAVMLDTTVYIGAAAGRLPIAISRLIESVPVFHSAVALAEVATGLARCDPDHPLTANSRSYYERMVASLPQARRIAPDPEVWLDAGLIAGILARTQRFQPRQQKECLNDALIALSAAKMGVPVVTANRDDFDLISQLAPECRLITY